MGGGAYPETAREAQAPPTFARPLEAPPHAGRATLLSPAPSDPASTGPAPSLADGLLSGPASSWPRPRRFLRNFLWAPKGISRREGFRRVSGLCCQRFESALRGLLPAPSSTRGPGVLADVTGLASARLARGETPRCPERPGGQSLRRGFVSFPFPVTIAQRPSAPGLSAFGLFTVSPPRAVSSPRSGRGFSSLSPRRPSLFSGQPRADPVL